MWKIWTVRRETNTVLPVFTALEAIGGSFGSGSDDGLVPVAKADVAHYRDHLVIVRVDVFDDELAASFCPSGQSGEFGAVSAADEGADGQHDDLQFREAAFGAEKQLRRLECPRQLAV
jgi:hypothetical protein